MALQREQSAHNPRKAALKHDGDSGVIEVKCARGPAERFEIVKDGQPLKGWELRRLVRTDESAVG